MKKNKHHYRVYGLAVSSEFEIRELNQCPEPTHEDIAIRLSDLGIWKPDAQTEFSFSEGKQVIVLPAVGAFVIIEDHTILVEPNPSVSISLLAVPLLGPIIAIVLHLRRNFVLHGSAVIYRGKAFGFVGDRGAGKSTLAAMLLKNPGVNFLADDLVVLPNPEQVLNGYPQLKLSDDALEHSDLKLGSIRPRPIKEFPKNQFLLNQRTSEEPIPIGGLFELRRAGSARVEALTLPDSIRVLLRFSYMARFVDRQMSDVERRDMFQSTTAIASSGKIKRIYVPDRISELNRIIELLDQ